MTIDGQAITRCAPSEVSGLLCLALSWAPTPTALPFWPVSPLPSLWSSLPWLDSRSNTVAPCSLLTSSSYPPPRQKPRPGLTDWPPLQAHTQATGWLPENAQLREFCEWARLRFSQNELKYHSRADRAMPVVMSPGPRAGLCLLTSDPTRAWTL